MKNRVGCYQELNYQSINIEDYLPLVNKMVNQLNIKESSIIDRDDLLSIGVMGLMDAVRKYKTDKNASFETYARLRIKGAIIDELRRLGILSRDQMTHVKRYYQKREELTQQLMVEPSDEQLCEYMDITSKELSKIYTNIHYLAVSSLDEVMYDADGLGRSLLEMMPDGQESILYQLERKDHYQELAEAIEKLDRREQYILQFYYVEELSLAQMSDILEISVSRISQLHGKAIATLRHHLQQAKG